MKSKIKQTPALLGNPEQANTWQIHIKTKNDWCEMRFSNKTQANEEYQRIKTMGIFCGQWVTEIILEEVYASTEPSIQ